MKPVINSMFFYFLMPAYAALALLMLFFNIPKTYYLGLGAYFLIITLPIVLITQFSSFSLSVSALYKNIKFSPTHLFFICSLVCFILLCSPLDIYFNGFKLLNPASYTEINGIGRYIRHFTILGWILIPFAFIYVKNPLLKITLISYALIFPIIIIDRNRLLISFYTLFLCLLLKTSSSMTKAPNRNKALLYLTPLLTLIIFSLIGSYRSGVRVLVPSSGSVLLLDHYPLKESFSYLPIILQQITLYIVTPLLNFATIVSAHFTNPDFLLSQLSPFSRENFDLHPYAPILVPRFNVGTEFYPFLLFGGLPMVLGGYLLMVGGFMMTYNLFKKWPNIFTLLLFIKISFIVLLMGFAPQFFMLLNLMFFIMIGFLWIFAEWVSKLSLFSRDKRVICYGT